MVGQRVRLLRATHKLSQDELVTALARLQPPYLVSRQQISSIEVGRSGASEEFIQAISELFNVSADFLLGWVESPLPPGELNLRAKASPRKAG